MRYRLRPSRCASSCGLVKTTMPTWTALQCCYSSARLLARTGTSICRTSVARRVESNLMQMRFACLARRDCARCVWAETRRGVWHGLYSARRAFFEMTDGPCSAHLCVGSRIRQRLGFELGIAQRHCCVQCLRGGEKRWRRLKRTSSSMRRHTVECAKTQATARVWSGGWKNTTVPAQAMRWEHDK